LSIIRAEGLESLSMRRLSRELDRSAMAPYWYVNDKRELLELVAKKLLSEVRIPLPDSGPWDERLREVLNGIDACLHDHPSVAVVLLERMTRTDQRLMTGIMDILRSAGFEGAQVFLCYAMIHTYLFGRYQVVSIQEDFTPAETSDLGDTLEDLLPSLNGLRGRDFFSFGVDTIIAGLKARLADRPVSAEPAKASTRKKPSRGSTPQTPRG
jgi:TetR/AcrR family tetracycline transcriptional repressor